MDGSKSSDGFFYIPGQAVLNHLATRSSGHSLCKILNNNSLPGVVIHFVVSPAPRILYPASTHSMPPSAHTCSTRPRHAEGLQRLRHQGQLATRSDDPEQDRGKGLFDSRRDRARFDLSADQGGATGQEGDWGRVGSTERSRQEQVGPVPAGDRSATVAHPRRSVTIPTLAWHRSSRRSARASRRRREEVVAADFAEEDEFVSRVEEAGVATGGVESAELSAGGLEAADEHRATAGGLMVRQATGKIRVVGQKNP